MNTAPSPAVGLSNVKSHVFIQTGLMIGALGVVFGDIGTSPLYAFRAALTVTGSTGELAVFGVLSLIFWALLLVVTAKYLGFILRADNEGEGGILALVALMKLHRKQDSRTAVVLLVTAIFGGALLFGDAILTPAISVLSAVEGIRQIAPSFAEWIVPIAVAIVAGLFVAQIFGVGRIGKIFGPIMLLWFGVLAISGLTGLVHEPQVLAALSPHYAVQLLWTAPGLSLALLGAIFLAVTGGEALYADLGQFGQKPIERAWLLIALPALVLNYFGQGAVVIGSGRVGESTFYALFPETLLPVIVVIATLATIIASQAVITGISSLSGQAVRLGFLPPIRILHLSSDNAHDLYVPVVNALVGLLTIVVVATFRSSDSLANAYGIAVAGAMITTTILFIAHQAKRPRTGFRDWILIAVPFGFLAVDLVFIAANADKVAHGGFLPLILGFVVFMIVQSWRAGQARMTALQVDDELSLKHYLDLRQSCALTNERAAVFLTRPGVAVPRALMELADLTGTVFSKVVLVSVRTSSVPKTIPESRIKFARSIDAGTLRVCIGIGYMESIDLPKMLHETLIIHKIDPDAVTYLVGLERPVPQSLLATWRAPAFLVYSVLSRLAARPTDRFALPVSRTLEVGMPRYL